jgi:hypothetical protein
MRALASQPRGRLLARYVNSSKLTQRRMAAVPTRLFTRGW